ncbi:MAG: hypothetical protein PHG06_21595 [Parabacteroides sp.]|nr:hypothetical protein [Parabacteroides sp.]
MQNNNTEESLHSPFSMFFGVADSQDVPDDYYEYVFYVGDQAQENLDYSINFRNATYRATDLTGDWEIRFNIPETLAFIKFRHINVL